MKTEMELLTFVSVLFAACSLCTGNHVFYRQTQITPGGTGTSHSNQVAGADQHHERRPAIHYDVAVLTWLVGDFTSDPDVNEAFAK